MAVVVGNLREGRFRRGAKQRADTSAVPTHAPAEQLIARHEDRNWLVLASHAILFRIGWVFKTESVIIPALVDAVAGAAWLRGCLPALNRFGQSIPPALFAGKIERTRHKKYVLITAMSLMAVTIGLLAVLCFSVRPLTRSWMPIAVLLLYGSFSACTGLAQVGWGVTQGKLIRATRRGRLFTVSTCLGVIPAVVLAWWLLEGWLSRPEGGFGLMFAATTFFFALSAASLFLLVEPASPRADDSRSAEPYYRRAWAILRRDRPFRRLCLVAMLFGTVPILFPHYQALGRERLGLSGQHMVAWIVVQNAALGLVSLVTGPMADRKGNRAVLRVLIFLTALTPLVAVALAHCPPDWGRGLYWLVFAPLGLTPVTLKTLVNYTLELAPPAEHSQYLSTLNLCVAIPFAFSPLVGLVLDFTNYEVVMLAGSGVILTSGMLTAGLVEPRWSHGSPATAN